MYFPPAAFDPGPAATVIGFALLLFLLAVPYAVSALPRIAPVFTRPSGLVALTLFLSAVEVAAVIAFHATAVHGFTLWSLFGVVLGRMAARQRLGELGDPVLEVTVLDADGAPVPRRED